jgi:hypothetical protein
MPQRWLYCVALFPVSYFTPHGLFQALCLLFSFTETTGKHFLCNCHVLQWAKVVTHYDEVKSVQWVIGVWGI